MAPDSDADPDGYYYVDSIHMEVYHRFEDCPSLGLRKTNVKRAATPQDIEFTDAGPVQCLADARLCATCEMRLNEDNGKPKTACPFCGERVALLPNHLPCE